MEIDTNMRDVGLYEELLQYGRSDFYPYHMPGHKRNQDAGAMAQYYGIDITEIDGFDDLHHAEGILRDAQQRANRLYGNEGTETFYLVNGSTCGVLASVLTAAEKEEEILIARNCHKSVYHAAILQELELRYYYPPLLNEYGICVGVDAGEIDRLLAEYPKCRAVVITSPTYEGIISDISAVAAVVHERDKILIVDEAHGAHLGLHESMPAGALAQGADLVIHSLHKTLPSMTQTALLHVQGERVNRGKLRRYLTMLQSSSPSYVLMASMDSCIRYVEEQGAGRYAFMREQYELFCKNMERCRYIKIGSMECAKRTTSSEDILKENNTVDKENDTAQKKCCVASWDISKLVIRVKDNVINGQQLYDLLREDYHLQMEMAAENYVLAIMTIMDTAEGWQRLADALLQIDGRIEEGITTHRGMVVDHCSDEQNRQEKEHRQDKADKADADPEDLVRFVDAKSERLGRQCGDINEGKMTIARAFLGKREEIPLAESVGKISADFVNLYPPGIPLIVPGETVCERLIAQIQRSMCTGLRVQGITSDGRIAVVF